MTIKVEFAPETEAKLRERAADAGIDMEQFVRETVEDRLSRPQTLAEILAPIHAETARLGITEEEIDADVEQCREEIYRERLAKRQQP